MRSIWTAFLLISCFASFGQSCDTIDGKVLNCTDANGLKQGYWEQTRKKVLMSWYGGYGTPEGCQYGEKAIHEPVAFGNFIDDRKIGKWKYFSDWIKKNGEYIVEKEITYNHDGSVIDDYRERKKYLLNINADTTEISGYFLHSLDTILIECVSNKCAFLVDHNTPLMTFHFDDFGTVEEELFGLMVGLKDREIRIKLKKTNPNNR